MEQIIWGLLITRYHLLSKFYERDYENYTSCYEQAGSGGT